MRPYRFRAVFLLFLVLNLTACQSWQSISLEDSIRLVELSEEDRVRVTGGGIVKGEVVEPSVEGDQLVGAGDFSMPLEDILGLEVRGFSLGRTVLMGFGGVVVLPVAFAIAILVDCGTGGCL